MTKGTQTIEDKILELEQRIQELENDTKPEDSSDKIEKLKEKKQIFRKRCIPILPPTK